MTDSENNAIYMIEKIVFNNLDNYCDNEEERKIMIEVLERMISTIKKE